MTPIRTQLHAAATALLETITRYRVVREDVQATLDAQLTGEMQVLRAALAASRDEGRLPEHQAREMRWVRNYLEWSIEVRRLRAFTVEHMTPAQLDWACALYYARPNLTFEKWGEVMGGTCIPALRCHLSHGQNAHGTEILISDGKGGWTPFSVTQDWKAFGTLISALPMVVSSHEGEDAEGRPTCWFNSHNYLGGTTVEGRDDLRLVAARSVSKLLQLKHMPA